MATPIIALPMGYNGPLAEGERLLAPMRRLGTTTFDDVGPKAYVDVQQIFSPAVFPHGMARYWKSSFLKDPGDMCSILPSNTPHRWPHRTR